MLKPNSKAVDAHTITKQAEKVKTNVCQEADGNSFLGPKGVLVV
jgi:hypothetical protein